MLDAIAILKRYGIQPSKGLGQNFLISERALERILEASELTADDVVLEVGPGVGLLTRQLAERAAAVTAIELDRKMLPILADTLKGCANAHVVEGDILELDPAATLRRALGLAECAPLRYKVAANLPYYITSSALNHLLEARPRPERLVVMVQREVAERLIAGPGDLSLLAISVQVYGAPELIYRVPASAFYPPPKVDSAVVRVRLYDQPLVPEGEIARFFRAVRAGFGQKRKQLHNSLTHNLGLPREAALAALRAADIAPDRRPQTLSIAEWAALARALDRTER